MRYHGANTIAHRRYIDSQGVRKQYPAYYGNYQNIPVPADCNVPDLIEWNEFPILRGKVPFGDDSNAGPDRVSNSIPTLFLRLTVLQIVLARKNDGTFTYCYTIYHKNNGDFAQCT